MFRFCENKILDWLNNKHDALLITGARQVGKTYIIRKVLDTNKINYFEINFYDRPELIEALLKTTNIDEFISKLRLYSEKELIPGQSVIFFDEVQAFPELMTKIKFLVDEGSFKYIISGSLLDVEIKNIRSIPVGYIEELKMYPLNLFEFAVALGVKLETINYLEKCFNNLEVVDSLIHKKMIGILNNYLVIGGMPRVVKTFLETKNLNKVNDEQKNIVELYKKDFTKYEMNDKKLKILSIYENMPAQLNKQNLKFVFSYLNKEMKFERYENSFLWLKDAGVSYPVYISKEVNSPLIMSKEKNTFKLFYNDIGLLSSNFPFDVKLEILENNNEIKINKRALLENFVCEELKSNNLDLYYYKSKNIGELDFLVETDLSLNIIEVKSGKDYKLHKSLDNILIDNKSYYKPYVLSFNNLEKSDNITYLPLYMTSFIKNTKSIDYIVDVDIKGL